MGEEGETTRTTNQPRCCDLIVDRKDTQKMNATTKKKSKEYDEKYTIRNFFPDIRIRGGEILKRH